MRKIMAIIVAMALVAMSGCGITKLLKEDKVPATAEITTSKGEAYVINSVNGANKTVSGATYAVTYAPVLLCLADGEEATIHFACPACGYEVEDTITAPFAKLYWCECPEEIDDSGNAREYISVTTSIKKTTE